MFPKRLLAPGFLTVMNLFLGYYSIVLAAKGSLSSAAWLIIIAAVFDAFDGKVARATNSTSKFGNEFDSLADVISFGLAPSFLIYQAHFHTMEPAGLLIAFFPLMFGAIRLARFNIQISGSEKVNFSGLPIPVAAGTLVSFILFNLNIWDEMMLKSMMLPLVIIISLLMVSTLEFDAIPKFNFRSGKRNSILFLVLLTGIITVVFFPHEAMFPLSLFYIIYSSVRGLLRLGREKTTGRVRHGKHILRRKKRQAIDENQTGNDQ